MDLGVAEQFFQGVELIRFFVIDVFNTGVDQYLETVDARRMGDVNCAVLYIGTIFRGLGDGVHFRVDRAKAILLGIAVGCFRLVDETADIGAMRHASRRAIIPGSKDILITHNDRADLGSGAGRAFGDLLGDSHEVLVPT